MWSVSLGLTTNFYQKCIYRAKKIHFLHLSTADQFKYVREYFIQFVGVTEQEAAVEELQTKGCTPPTHQSGNQPLAPH